MEAVADATDCPTALDSSPGHSTPKVSRKTACSRTIRSKGKHQWMESRLPHGEQAHVPVAALTKERMGSSLDGVDLQGAVEARGFRLDTVP